MIDRIRQDIQERLDQLLSEAERLRQALTALGSDRGESAARPAASTSTSSSSRSRSRAGTRTRAASAAARPRGGRPRAAAASSSRASAGGTKNSVLKALSDADGRALTASEVAAATGLGRASVSTTLSKLARAGEVTKADRGYQIGGGAPSVTAGAAASSES